MRHYATTIATVANHISNEVKAKNETQAKTWMKRLSRYWMRNNSEHMADTNMLVTVTDGRADFTALPPVFVYNGRVFCKAPGEYQEEKTFFVVMDPQTHTISSGATHSTFKLKRWKRYTYNDYVQGEEDRCAGWAPLYFSLRNTKYLMEMVKMTLSIIGGVWRSADPRVTFIVMRPTDSWKSQKFLTFRYPTGNFETEGYWRYIG